MTINERNSMEATPKHHWGARFKAAREALNLSEKDAASRLHLKPHLIHIIESERFEKGPPAIFMRGYIRSYGKLLNISEREITQALAQLNLANPAASSISPSIRPRNNNQNHNIGWSTTLVVFVLVGLVGVWWHTHSRSSLKDLVANIPVQLRSVMNKSNGSLSVSNSINAQTQSTQTAAEPTPAELLPPEPNITATNTAPTANEPTVQAQQNVAETTPPTEAVSPTTQTETHTATIKPATSNNPQMTENKPQEKASVIDEQKILADTDDEDSEPAIKPKKHKPATHNPDVANNEMVIPEQGLEIDNNIN